MSYVINTAASVAPLVFICASLWIQRRRINASEQVVGVMMARLYDAAEIKGKANE